MTKQLIFPNYILEYFIEDNYVIITNIIITNHILENIYLPEIIENLPVEKIVLYESINMLRFNLNAKFILPNTIKYSYCDKDNSDTRLLFDEKPPRDLIYNYGFYYKAHNDIDTPKNLLCSCYNKKNVNLYGNINIDNLDIQFNNKFDIKYSGFNLDYRGKCSLAEKYRRNIEKNFPIFNVEYQGFLLKCLINNDKVYIYRVDIISFYTRTLIIPDCITYNNRSYEVVGLCPFCLFEREEIMNLIVGRNVEYIGIAALHSHINVYLNDKIKFIGQFDKFIKLYNFLTNQNNITIFGYDDSWTIFTPYEDKLRYLIVPWYDHDKEDINIRGIRSELLSIKQSNEIPNIDYHNNEYFINDNNNIYRFNQTQAELICYNDYLSDVINIPDEIVVNLGNQDKTIPLTRICKESVYTNKPIDKLIIGKNIEEIDDEACYLKSCKELIFNGRKIEKIGKKGLNINIKTDKLIVPNSITTLESCFISGFVNEIIFEKISRLLYLKNSCFKDLGIVLKMVLPKSVIEIEKESVDNIVDLSFEDGNNLSLKKFASDVLQPKYYEFGKYIGTASNPYLVCVRSSGYLIHPDCLYVFNAEIFVKTNPNVNIYNSRIIKKSIYNVIDNDFLEKIHEIKSLTPSKIPVKLRTKYQNCYYLKEDDNPYAVLCGAVEPSLNYVVHKDCKYIINNAFKNVEKIHSINFEGDNILYIGKNIAKIIDYINIPNSVVFIDENPGIDYIYSGNKKKRGNEPFNYQYMINHNPMNNNILANNKNAFEIGNKTIFEFLSEYINNIKIKLLIPKDFIIDYAGGDENKFSCIFYQNESTNKCNIFQLYKDGDYLYMYHKYNNILLNSYGLIIAWEYYKKEMINKIMNSCKNLLNNCSELYQFLINDNLYNINNKRYNIINFNKNNLLLSYDNTNIYYVFEKNRVIGYGDNINEDIFLNGLSYIHFNIINNLDKYDDQLDFNDVDLNELNKYEYKFDNSEYYHNINRNIYPLLSNKDFEKLSKYDITEMEIDYIESLRGYGFLHKDYTGIYDYINNFQKICIKTIKILKPYYEIFYYPFYFVKFSEKDLLKIFTICHNNIYTEKIDFYFDFLKYQDFSIDFFIEFILNILNKGDEIDLRLVPCVWRNDEQVLKKLNMLLKLNGNKIK